MTLTDPSHDGPGLVAPGDEDDVDGYACGHHHQAYHTLPGAVEQREDHQESHDEHEEDREEQVHLRPHTHITS